jgi:hypothetical protein
VSGQAFGGVALVDEATGRDLDEGDFLCKFCCEFWDDPPSASAVSPAAVDVALEARRDNSLSARPKIQNRDCPPQAAGCQQSSRCWIWQRTVEVEAAGVDARRDNSLAARPKFRTGTGRRGVGFGKGRLKLKRQESMLGEGRRTWREFRGRPLHMVAEWAYR